MEQMKKGVYSCERVTPQKWYLEQERGAGMFQSSVIRKGGKCWRRTPFRQDYTEKRLKQYPSVLEGVRRLKSH